MLIVDLVVRLDFHQDRRQYLLGVEDVFLGRLVVSFYKDLRSLRNRQREVRWSERHHCFPV